ncbi:MAG: WYL domain-containing protein [Ruminococcus flavefaciens]|nr:WYL domain-containing protein [Ruminococcus flavefaciens]
MNNERIMRIVEILKTEADKEHPMKTEDIARRLNAQNLASERRSVARDVKRLKEIGFDIVMTHIGHSQAFYIEQKGLTLGELKILMDAVQAATFIPEGQTNELLDKLAGLSVNHKMVLLRGNIVHFNTRKQKNEEVIKNVEEIESALQRQIKVSFLYFHHNENMERVYTHNGERHLVEPIALIYDNDRYYLLCFNPKHSDRRTYRIDRMESVSAVNELVSDNALISESELADYTGKTFKMFGGREAEALFEFDESLIDVIFDQFGCETEIVPVESENDCDDASRKFCASVTIHVSPTFWGWYFQFPDKMRICSPDWLVEECEKWRGLRYGGNKDEH